MEIDQEMMTITLQIAGQAHFARLRIKLGPSEASERVLLGPAASDIGGAFGGVDHSSVIHSLERVVFESGAWDQRTGEIRRVKYFEPHRRRITAQDQAIIENHPCARVRQLRSAESAWLSCRCATPLRARSAAAGEFQVWAVSGARRRAEMRTLGRGLWRRKDSESGL